VYIENFHRTKEGTEKIIITKSIFISNDQTIKGWSSMRISISALRRIIREEVSRRLYENDGGNMDLDLALEEIKGIWKKEGGMALSEDHVEGVRDALSKCSSPEEIEELKKDHANQARETFAWMRGQ
jgi:hypothetical protein